MAERHFPSFSDINRYICGLPMEGHPECKPPRPDPDFGQPWKAEQRVKGGHWSIVNSVGRTVCEGIDTYAEADFIVSLVNRY